MSKYNLHRWKVAYSNNNPWRAPEQIRVCLVGFRDQELEPVKTSSIKSVNGREVTTSSGSVYILQDIDPEYAKWMEDNNIKYNPDNPITMKQ